MHRLKTYRFLVLLVMLGLPAGLLSCRPATPLPPTNLPPTILSATSTNPAPTRTTFATHPPPSTPTPRPTSDHSLRRNEAVPATIPTPTPFLVMPEPAGLTDHPTLADFWTGKAVFVLDKLETGLPMGESDTIVMGNGELWSYLHSSSRHHAGAMDQCADPVPFPGCTVIYRSLDGGRYFQHTDPPVCQFACQQCPCDNETDQIAQQQYPRVYYDGETLHMVYEHLGRVMVRRSTDGLVWSDPQRVAGTGIWKTWLAPCPAAGKIGAHPFVPYDFECLAGGPPGLFVADGELFVFLATGQSPGGMGCYRGPTDGDPAGFQPCENNPLFRGAEEYGPLESSDAAANPYFDFRTISSADVIAIVNEEGTRYYMLYEGLRGPGPGDSGDTQFGLGLARSLTTQIDGPWETYPGNPLLVDLPGNIGLGHADLVVVNGQTVLYTSLDGIHRSRLVLMWK